MARVVVNVMPKKEILDPQGQAVHRALSRIGVTGVTDVRQGKQFVLDVDDTVTEQDLHEVAAKLLANTVIEDFTIEGFGTEGFGAEGSATESAGGESK